MPREHRYFVYILSSKSRRIYTGVTNNITRRVAQHKPGIPRFHPAIQDQSPHVLRGSNRRTAIHCEKEIKHWIRAQRVALIERENATWDDLAEDWASPSNSSSLSLSRRQQIPHFVRDDKGPQSRCPLLLSSRAGRGGSAFSDN